MGTGWDKVRKCQPKEKQYDKYWYKIFQDMKVIFKSTIKVQLFLKAPQVEGDEVKAIITLHSFEAFFLDKASRRQAKKKIEEERVVQREIKEKIDMYWSVIMQGKRMNMVHMEIWWKKKRNKTITN